MLPSFIQHNIIRAVSPQYLAFTIILLSLPLFNYFWLRIHRVAVKRHRLAAVLYSTLTILGALIMILRPSPPEYFFIGLPTSFCLAVHATWVFQMLPGGRDKRCYFCCEKACAGKLSSPLGGFVYFSFFNSTFSHSLPPIPSLEACFCFLLVHHSNSVYLPLDLPQSPDRD
jgi:hypothetical protein